MSIINVTDEEVAAAQPWLERVKELDRAGVPAFCAELATQEKATQAFCLQAILKNIGADIRCKEFDDLIYGLTTSGWISAHMGR